MDWGKAMLEYCCKYRELHLKPRMTLVVIIIDYLIVFKNITVLRSIKYLPFIFFENKLLHAITFISLGLSDTVCTGLLRSR